MVHPCYPLENWNRITMSITIEIEQINNDDAGEINNDYETKPLHYKYKQNLSDYRHTMPNFWEP
jgi:hypothetical protein